ncbi:LOW QUALITY PROTEIN: uncharacterized protein KIAA2012 homolog [Chlamydotis macqueenii]
MTGFGVPNLSLLICGIGQVVKKDQEKLEVHYEPEVTYSTGTGVLVLYSDNLAEPSWKKGGRRMGLQGHKCGRKLEMELHSLQDFTRVISAYRGKRKDHKGTPWHPYLHFLNKPDNQIDQQICPGYLSKSYLFRLLNLRSWHNRQAPLHRSVAFKVKR